MNYEIVDNFLEKKYFKEIKDIITSTNFKWSCSNVVNRKLDDYSSAITSSYYFAENIYDEHSFAFNNHYPIFRDLLNNIKCKSLMRIKANLYPSTKTVEYHNNHIDYDFSHKGMLIFLNTNDGYTVLDEKIFVESIENRVLFFDPSILHQSTSCTDDPIGRFNINFNYF